MEIFCASALTGEGMAVVLDRIVSSLHPGDCYYPPDQLADKPLRFLCAEMIREKIFHFTGEEIPYAVAVEISSFQENLTNPDGPIFIEANIHVERPTQKGILIGKGGQMIKKIGMTARQEIEAFLDAKVVLKLWVKISKGWRNDPKSLRWLGYK